MTDQAAQTQQVPPTVGRMVHYRSYGTPGGEYEPQCRAATIAEVGAWITTRTIPSAGSQQRTLVQMWDAEACALVVQNPTGQFFNTCRHAEATPDDPPYGFPGGTWHWPCVRV